MHVGLHQFRAETIRWFCDAVSEEGRTRNSLARDLCTLEGWTGDRGEYCLGSARKALPVLADKLGLELPTARVAFWRAVSRWRADGGLSGPFASLPGCPTGHGDTGAGVGGYGPPALGVHDGDAPPARLGPRAGRPTALLGLFVGPWTPWRYRVLRRELAPEGARRLHRLVHGRASREPLEDRQQPSLSASAWRAGSRSGLPGAATGDETRGDRLGGDVQGAPGDGLQLCRPRPCRHLLSGGGLGMLSSPDLGPAAGVRRRRPAAHGVDEAAGCGLAGGVVC